MSIFRALLYKILPLGFTIIFIYLISTDFLVYFYTIPNTFGHDSSAHFAAISLYTLHSFPALWGWISEWYAGMPFPLFYPPLPHYFSSLFFSQSYIHNVFIFKLLSHVFVLGNIICLYQILQSYFKREILKRQNHIVKTFPTEWKMLQHFRTQLPIVVALVIVFLLNQGAPSFNSLVDGLYSHQFAMFWFTLTIWSFWKNTRFYLILGSLSVAILLLSNIHAFLTACTILPFIVILNGVYSKDTTSLIGRILKQILLSSTFFSLGLTITLCWSLSMGYYYSYFAGVHTIQTGLSNEFLSYAWPILIIIPLSIFASIKKHQSEQLKINIPLLISCVILLGIDVLQRLDIPFHLPVQLWRWYETIFVLTVFPLTQILFILLQKYKHLGVAILLFMSIFIVSREKYITCCIYQAYTTDNVPGLIEAVQKKPEDLTFVHGRASPQYTTLRQMTLDSELAIAGVHTIFSTFRESSINSVFLRIAKHIVSPEEENWALLNFIQTTSIPYRHIDTYNDLFTFLGINQIILGNDDLFQDKDAITFRNTNYFTISKSPASFTILNKIKTQSRATQITTPLTLIFAENGFRDRKISDPTYTRFQEISFEKKLYTRSITFNPHTPVIEENVDEINKAKYIVLATLETKDINKALEVIENSLQHPDRKIFILANKAYAEEYKEFVKKFARNKQVIFVDVRNNIFPFDEVISRIIASEPFEYREDPLSIEMSNTNINISNPYVMQKQDQHIPLQSQHLTQTIWFIRQSYFPAWLAQAQDGTRVPTYLASPGYTLVFPDKNTSISLYFSTPRIVIIGHIISLIGLMTLLTITLYQYRVHHITSPKRKKDVK